MRISDWSSDMCSSDLVSGSISLPSPGFFSPFPHGTGSLSVGQEYLALEDGPPMFRQGFTCPALLTFHHSGPFAYRAVTFYGQSFQTVLLEPEQLLGCSPFARRYWGNLGCFLFLRLLSFFRSEDRSVGKGCVSTCRI